MEEERLKSLEETVDVPIDKRDVELIEKLRNGVEGKIPSLKETVEEFVDNAVKQRLSNYMNVIFSTDIPEKVFSEGTNEPD